MSDNPLSGKLELDTSNYKAGVAELNRQIRNIESGFRAASASLGQWDRTANGLEMRNASLTKEISLQQQKVDGLTSVYKDLVAGGKASSKTLEDMENDINKATEALEKSKYEFKQNEEAMGKMGSETKGTGKSVEDLGKKEEKTTSHTNGLKTAMGGAWSVAKVGATVVAGLAGAVVGIGAGMARMITSSANAADELNDMSGQTGISVARLQELQYIGEQVGVDLNTISDANAKITRSMGQAETAGSAQAKTFKSLGISIYDTNGQMRDSQDVFNEAIGALGGIQNETERDLVSNTLFGKSFQDLNPLIKAGSEELQRLTGEANKNGAVMSDKAVAGLGGFADMLAGLKMGLKGTVGELSAALLPGMQGILDTGQGYLKALVYVVQGSGGDLGKLSSGLGTLFGNILGDISKKLPSMMNAGLGVLQGLIDAIMKNLPVMLPAMMTMIQSLTGFIVQSLPMLMEAALQIIMMLANGLVAALPMLLQALVDIIMKLALGIAAAAPQLINTVMAIIPVLIQALITAAPLLMQAGLQMLVAIAQGIGNNLPALIKAIPGIFVAIIDAIIKMVPMLWEAGNQILEALYYGLDMGLQMAGEEIGKMLAPLLGAFKAQWDKFMQIGRDLINGLWRGFKTQWETFLTNISNLVKGLIQWLKDLLGIHSPSSVFADMGKNMAAGLGEGFQNEMAKVKRGMNNLAVGGFGFNAALAGAGGQWNSNSEMFAFYAPVVIQEGDSGSLGKKLKAKKY